MRRLTPPGVGGVAVIAIDGPAVDTFLDRHFQTTSSTTSGLAHGRVVDGQEVIDEVLCRRARAGGVELSIHGSPAVERRLSSLLAEMGFEPVPDEDLEALAAEVDALLREATAEQTVLYALEVGRGSLRRELESLCGDLLRSRSPMPGLADRLSTLIARARFGLAFSRPPVVVVCGPVNAGKSTLVNALIGHDRVVTSAEPGATRDAVEIPADFEGYPFSLVDVAGERATTDTVEAVGIDRARRARSDADIVLEVRPAQDLLDNGPFPSSPTCIAVASKIDLDPTYGSTLSRCQPGVVATSGHTGEGLDGLRARIVRASAFGGPMSREFPGPFTVRQVDLLALAWSRIDYDLPAASAALREILEGPSPAECRP